MALLRYVTGPRLELRIACVLAVCIDAGSYDKYSEINTRALS